MTGRRERKCFRSPAPWGSGGRMRSTRGPNGRQCSCRCRAAGRLARRDTTFPQFDIFDVLFKRGKRVVQFLFACRAGNVMAHNTAECLRLNRIKFAKSLLDHRSAHGHERVAVVEAKWSKLMTLTANLQSLPEGHSDLARLLPKFSRRFVSFRSWFVKRVFFFAEA